MGLYFNTKTTRTMQEKVNEQFRGTAIAFWKAFERRKDFQKAGAGKPLHAIAGQARIEPDEPGAKPRWVGWLKDLERDTKDEMRDIFFEHLDPAAKCKELIFVPVLKSSMPIKIERDEPINGPDGYSLTVYIHTPPARVVRAAIKKRKDAIAKRPTRRRSEHWCPVDSTVGHLE